jgi:hypothetical protein
MIEIGKYGDTWPNFPHVRLTFRGFHEEVVHFNSRSANLLLLLRSQVTLKIVIESIVNNRYELNLRSLLELK